MTGGAELAPKSWPGGMPRAYGKAYFIGKDLCFFALGNSHS